MRFRKKPVEIEAVQFTYPPTPELLAFCGDNIRNIRKARHPGAKAEADIVTLEDGSDGRAKHVATEGDWIVKGVKGEIYPVKPDIFAATYEPVSMGTSHYEIISCAHCEATAFGVRNEAGELVC